MEHPKLNLHVSCLLFTTFTTIMGNGVFLPSCIGKFLVVLLALLWNLNHNLIQARKNIFTIHQVDNNKSMNRAIMKIRHLNGAKKSYPTGNPNFSVMQAFPGGISDSDPFLMCDHFGPKKSDGLATDPDRFPIGWHPHRGMDILTYMIRGKGRHADSMGNRETFDSPGMQWISVGSGIEHAEGGGTPAGELEEGFQIWINVPAKHKMDPPAYGTNPPERIPFLTLGEGVTARLLAGQYHDATGPFETKQDVQMIEYMLEPNASIDHIVKDTHDNCMVYVYRGNGELCDTAIHHHQIAQLDASSADRTMSMRAGAEGIRFIIFAGKRINEPVAWRGPFVMNTYEEIQDTMMQYHRGEFPPVRVPWDYQTLAAFPSDPRKDL